MRASIELAKLADRVSAAEDAVVRSADRGKDELRAQADAAQVVVQQTSAELKEATAAQSAGERWRGFHAFWDVHVAQAKREVAHQHALSESDRAQRRAESTEIDARLAVQLAHAAVEDAEYTLLESGLARMEAEDAAAAAATTR